MRKYLLYIIILSLIFIGCTTPKEIIREVPVEITKEVEKEVVVHDSTFIHDSVIIYTKGDTVFKEKIKYIYIGRQVHDSIAIHDTIEKPIYSTKEKIVNKPQWWPVWLSLGIVVLYFLITKTKFIIKLKEFIKYIINLFK